MEKLIWKTPLGKTENPFGLLLRTLSCGPCLAWCHFLVVSCQGEERCSAKDIHKCFQKLCLCWDINTGRAPAQGREGRRRPCREARARKGLRKSDRRLLGVWRVWAVLPGLFGGGREILKSLERLTGFAWEGKTFHPRKLHGHRHRDLAQLGHQQPFPLHGLHGDSITLAHLFNLLNFCFLICKLRIMLLLQVC